MQPNYSRTIQSFVISLLLFVHFGLYGQESDSLMTGHPGFDLTSHVVGVSMFHWYGANTGQVSGPWIPLEGRESWTGDVEFWKRMIKQTMAANIDVYYVHLIPHMEEARSMLFRALFELRKEGWDVPKVCPFFDPLITYDIQGSNVDVSTDAGKDNLVGHYIRFYEQFFNENQDEYAEDYIYIVDGKVVLDTWHVHINIANYQSLQRYHITNRLTNSLGNDHGVFFNGIRMITNAVSPTYGFADEKVHQFEVHEYYITKKHNNIVSAQLKPGYWDQNIRDPGYILPRDGGKHYRDSWDRVNNNSGVHRVYIESFNEYDEGSGIYAAKTDEIYYNEINTESDFWSDTDDPYEYIKTTAAGAAAFNDDEDLNAKILWNNIPKSILPGDTIVATVVVRNTGNTSWSDASGFKFGQQDNDPLAFGSSRYLIDDTQHDIPVYGGIFRGRALSFNVEIIAPETEGSYMTHWGMLQEGVAWFGEPLEKKIRVSLSANSKQRKAQTEFTVYPNPVSLNPVIQIDGEFIKNDRIVLFNSSGAKICEEEITHDSGDFSLNLQKYRLSRGMYFVQIIQNKRNQTLKISVHNEF